MRGDDEDRCLPPLLAGGQTDVAPSVRLHPAQAGKKHRRRPEAVVGEAPGAVEIEHGDIASCQIPGFRTLSNPVIRP